MGFLNRNYKILILLVLFLIGLSIYSNSFTNKFFWDDDDSIVNNIYIKDWKYLPNYFTQNLIAGAGQTTNYWRPVLLISFAIDYHIWGLNPFGFHLANTLLHILNAWLIFLLLLKLFSYSSDKSPLGRGGAERRGGLENSKTYRLSTSVTHPAPLEQPSQEGNINTPPLIKGGRGDSIISFLVSLLFLIHPLQTEAVTYVAGRADPLSTFFSLLAILFYIKYREDHGSAELSSVENYRNVKNPIWKYLLAISFFILGILTKEQTIILPLLILLIEIVFLTKTFEKIEIIKIIKINIPFFIISLAYFISRITVLNFNNIVEGFKYSDVYNASVFNRLLTFFTVLLDFFKLLFVPFNLHMEREIQVVTSVLSLPIILFLLLSALIIFICIKTWQKNRMVAFGFLWYFIILLPRTNLIKINRPMYEHWLYLPMVGFWLAIICLVYIWLEKINNKDPRYKIQDTKMQVWNLKYGIFFVSCILYLGICVFFSYLTFERNRDWHDPITFYEKNLKYTPNSFIQHNNLGMAYADADRTADAIREYKKAISISDTYPQVHYNLGNGLYSIGSTGEAIKEYNKSIQMSPTFLYPYQNLVKIYMDKKDINKIDETLKRMELGIGKGAEVYYFEGVAYYNLKLYDKAIRAFREALNYEPDNIDLKLLIDRVKGEAESKL